MTKPKNRQGVTFFHDLYVNYLQYMDDALMGKLIRIAFIYSIDKANGVLDAEASIPWDSFQGYDLGALRAAIGMVDRSCDGYLNKSINTKLKSIEPDKSKWDAIKGRDITYLRKVGFSVEQIAYMKNLDENTINTQVNLSTHEHSQEHKQETETKQEFDQEQKPKQEIERLPQTPLTRPMVMTALESIGISLGDANAIVNKHGVDGTMKALNDWEQDPGRISFSQFLSGWR